MMDRPKETTRVCVCSEFKRVDGGWCRSEKMTPHSHVVLRPLHHDHHINLFTIARISMAVMVVSVLVLMTMMSVNDDGKVLANEILSTSGSATLQSKLDIEVKATWKETPLLLEAL